MIEIVITKNMVLSLANSFGVKTIKIIIVVVRVTTMESSG